MSLASPLSRFKVPALLLLAGLIFQGCGAASSDSSGVASTGASTWSTVGARTGTSSAAASSGPVGQDSTGSQGSSTSNPDPSPTDMELSLPFEAKVAGAPFVCGQTYQGVGASQSTISPVDFRFYVHNLRLVNLQGQEVPVTIPERSPWQAQGVALLDFENDAGNCRFGGDSGLNAQITGSAPSGTYKGLRFTLGVPSELNHQDPLSLGAPFQSGGMLWNWLSGFKFLAIEFRSGEVTGLLHIGSTACTGGGPKAVVCSKSNRAEVFLPDFVPGVSRIAADLGAIFAQIDLGVDQICHSDQQASCAPLFVQTGVNWASGAPMDAQSFFSVVGPGGD